MPVLNWIGKQQVVNHDKDVPFKLLNKDARLSVGESKNLLIKGDNLEALKALMPYYAAKVKCIYIDPPYNTGNQKWVYNDRVDSPEIKKWLGQVVGPEGEDLNRHDKWLCMMLPRLKLLWELLSEDGVICISIDDTEVAQLINLMDEVFGKHNKEEIICWRRRHNQPNDKSKAISKVAEFIVVYAKNLDYLKSQKAFHGLPLTGNFSNPDNDPKGDWASKPWKAGTNQSGSKYKLVTPTGRALHEEWLGSKETYEEYLKEGRIFFPNKGNGSPRKKYYKFEREKEGQCAHNFWEHQEFGSNQEASNEIKELGIEFDNPKPTRLIKGILTIFSNKDSIILDSFVGSGTTGHAVLDLNKEDSGKRKFLLVEMESNIAEDITAKRLKKVINGYSHNGKKTKGLGGGFQFMRLGTTLFDTDGFISEDVTFKDLAQYIYFTETKTALNTRKINGLFIGEKSDTEYYLLFNGIKKNVLDNKAIKRINKNKKAKVFYADRCLLDKEILKRRNITFKQIPYEVKVY